MNQRKPRHAWALFLIVLLAGCQSLSGIRPLTESASLDAEYAEDIARLNMESERLHQDFKRKGLLVTDALCNSFIEDLARQLMPPLQSGGVVFRVFLVKNATPNAIALPNGDIYVFSGLLTLAQNEDQLASVIAHEIGHVVHRHGLKSAVNHRNTVVTAHITNILLFGTNLAYLPAGASLASFSREMEREADQLGLQYMAATNYDVRQSPAIFERFAQLPRANSIDGSIYSSHPDNEERIRYLNEQITAQYPHEIAPRLSGQFVDVRSRLVELNVKLRLRAKQYQMALNLLDETASYYPHAETLTYYRGEALRLMAEHPMAAAREYAWLNEKSESEDDKKRFMDAAAENRQRAIQLFNSIADSADAPMEVHRGLGLIYQQHGEKEKARFHLQTYLAQETPPRDRLFIQHQLEQLN